AVSVAWPCASPFARQPSLLPAFFPAALILSPLHLLCASAAPPVSKTRAHATETVARRKTVFMRPPRQTFADLHGAANLAGREGLHSAVRCSDAPVTISLTRG